MNNKFSVTKEIKKNKKNTRLWIHNRHTKAKVSHYGTGTKELASLDSRFSRVLFGTIDPPEQIAQVFSYFSGANESNILVNLPTLDSLHKSLVHHVSLYKKSDIVNGKHLLMINFDPYQQTGMAIQIKN